MPEVMDKSILEALSTDTRREIIKLLANRPYTASELSSKLKKHVTTVTEHLNVLEKSELVRKKESSNKWVYYVLTSKGERIFKPTYYSWVIVLSLSLLCLMIGAQQLIAPTYFGATAASASDFLKTMTTEANVIRETEQTTKEQETADTEQGSSAATAASTLNDTNTTTTTTSSTTTSTSITPTTLEPTQTAYSNAGLIRIVIGTTLIAISLIGFSYIIIKKVKK